MNPLWNAGYRGAGQHIGITMWMQPPSDSILQQFSTTTGASAPTRANGRLKVVPVDGGAVSSDIGEAAMDIEYSSAMAPDATVTYYEIPTDSSGSPTDQGVLDALNVAATDGTGNLQITNSWSGCEINDSWTAAAESILASNAATGHTYFFSSGDSGSWCGGTDPYPNYPSSSAYVTSVGGTKFAAVVNGTYPGETAMTYSCGACPNGPVGSGGGYSNLFSRPSWQIAAGLANDGMRAYPDIAADGDLNTGAYVCYGTSTPCGAEIGGTSLSSPLWAGMLADIHQYVSAQGASVGFLSPVLYALATHAQPYPAFHDVTSGTNGSYLAGSGWDAVTGWGSVDAWSLARDLAATSAPPPTATPSPGPTYTPTSAAPTATPSPMPKTSTPVPSPTASPTNNPPTATPLTKTSTPTSTPGGTTTQLISNGGFENGQSPWQESSAGGYQLIDPSKPHTGSESAWFCGVASCNDQLWQTVTLPSGSTQVTLSYYLAVTASSSPCGDSFTVQIRTAGGSPITSSALGCPSTSGWVQKTWSLSSALGSYGGQQIQVYVHATTTSGSTTSFYVDDVSLTTAGGSGGPPTATNTPLPMASATPTSTLGTGPTQLISNGGFENGQSPWQESSAGGYQLIDPSKPHTGSESAWFCGVSSCNDQLWQTVTLPSGSTQVTLGYWLAVTASASPCGDTFTVQIRTTGGIPITTTSLGCPATSGWAQKTWNLSNALAGYGSQQIQVYFHATTVSGSTTSVYVDDVGLTAS